MSKHYNILPIGASFFKSNTEKIESARKSKLSFWSSCFIAGDSHTKIISLVVFNKNSILSF